MNFTCLRPHSSTIEMWMKASDFHSKYLEVTGSIKSDSSNLSYIFLRNVLSSVVLHTLLCLYVLPVKVYYGIG